MARDDQKRAASHAYQIRTDVQRVVEAGILMGVRQMIGTLEDSIFQHSAGNPDPGEVDVLYDELLDALSQWSTYHDNRQLCFERLRATLDGLHPEIVNMKNLTAAQLHTLELELAHAITRFQQCMLAPATVRPTEG